MELKKGYKQTEIGVIPNDWDVKALGDIGESLIGLTYRPSDVSAFGTLVLRSSNIQESALRFDDNVFVDAEIPQRIIVIPGDILVCVRNGSRDLIGKSALLDARAIGMTFGAFMAVFRSRNGQLLHQLFQSEIIKKQINEHLGATINQITNKSLNSFKVPLAPTEVEQRAIAGALSDVDALLAALDRLIAKKRDLKQSAMQELLTGKRRLPRFRDAWKTKGTPRFESQKAQTIPSDWDMETLDRICVPDGLVRGPFGGTLRKEFFVREGYKVYEQKNAIYRDPDMGSYFIDAGKYRELKRFEIREGDFIVSCSGTIGRIFQIPRHAAAGVINQALLKIKTDSQVIHDRFFYYLFDWGKFQQQIVDNSQGGAMQNLVGMDVFRKVPIPLPSLLEQHAIADVLSDIDAEIMALEQRREKTRLLKQGMMQELLTGKTRLI